MVEWPANVLCLTLPDSGKTFAIVRPSSYEDLITRSASLLRLTNSIIHNIQEIYFESHDFGFEKAVEILPEVWDAAEGLQFFKQLDIRVRKIGVDPQNTSKICLGKSTGFRTRPLSPASSSSSGVFDGTHQSFHSVPARRTNHSQRDAAHVGSEKIASKKEEEETVYEESEVELTKVVEPERTMSRMSPQSSANTGRVRPIKVKRERWREVYAPQSQDSQSAPHTQEPAPNHANDIIIIPVQYGSKTEYFRAKPHTVLSSVVDRACKFSGIDRTRVKLFRFDSFDGSTPPTPFECSLKDTVGSLHPKVEKDEIFSLRMYEPSESE